MKTTTVIWALALGGWLASFALKDDGIFQCENGYVAVRNNVQPKIKPEPSTHFSLQSLVKRYQLLGERPVIVETTVLWLQNNSQPSRKCTPIQKAA